LSARIREKIEDFVVDEIPLYAPSGTGGHTFVRVEKRERTTDEVARALARAAGTAPAAVGYAGRKDRRALARQWFSVPALEPERALALELPGARVLAAARHPHKLRTGQLRGNVFSIAVRGVDADAAARARRRLDEIASVGLPNRYGAQRFGREGDNAARGRAVLEGRLRLRDRRTARFLVSALQAAVFNEVLARRPLRLDAVEKGEVAQVVASGGCFVVEDALAESSRAAAFEVSATGPLFGGRMLPPRGAPAERERQALESFGLAPESVACAPPGLRLRGARRPLRVPLREAALDHAGDVLRACFTLPAGSFATVLIEELLGPVDDAGRADDGPAGAGLL
jgi:tRNA pseudouridine13 synthase